MKLRLICLLGLTILSTGCATVTSGSSQNIAVKVIDSSSDGELMTNVRCTFTDGNGDRYVVQNGNPGNVSIPKGRGELSVSCKKDGYRQLNASVGDSFNKTALLNVLFWPGAIVDGITGAYKKYPSHYVISMEKITK